MGATSNYTLAANVLAPDQTVALARSGSLSLGVTRVEGVPLLEPLALTG